MRLVHHVPRRPPFEPVVVVCETELELRVLRYAMKDYATQSPPHFAVARDLEDRLTNELVRQAISLN